MKSVNSTLAFISCACLLAFALSACDTANWYPSGEASVVTYDQVDESGARTAVIGLKVTNTGTVPISRSTVSVALQTDHRAYYRTTTVEGVVLPSSSVYSVLTIPFLQADDTAAITDCTIDGFFCE
jgi:hypothetical protein